MKRLLLLTGLLVVLSCLNVQAADLQWDHTDVAITDGYVVYFNETGQVDAPYNKTMLKAALVVSGQTLTFLNFEPLLNLPMNLPMDQTWDIWVTAYDASGQSGPSNTVQHMIPGVPPFVSLPDVLPIWETIPIPGTPYGLSRRIN
jgi:hypothetical protein